MATMGFEILIILLLVIVNGVFAMAEIAVVSARKTRLQQRADEGDTRAQMALRLANKPNRFLATVQIAITLVGVLAGAFGGTTVAKKLDLWLSQVPLLAPYSEAVGVGIVVLAITYLSLVIGELAPKRLALTHPEDIATAIATPMQSLSLLAYPLVRLLSVSTDAVLWILRVQPSTAPPVTEEEISLLIGEGTQAGVFEEAEQEMVEGVFRFADRRVSMLMTSRSEVVWLDAQDPFEEIQRQLEEAAHSRFPVGEGALDNVLGVVYTKDLLSDSLTGQPVDLRASLRQPLFVPENARALSLLESFKRSGKHIALVVNEYGGMEGLATANDVLEAIVGDMPSIFQSTEPQIIQRRDGSWLMDGMLPIDEFQAVLDISTLPEGKVAYETVGGFVMARLGRIPLAGDVFKWEGLHFEVMAMDGRRVDRVLVTPRGSADGAGG